MQLYKYVCSYYLSLSGYNFQACANTGEKNWQMLILSLYPGGLFPMANGDALVYGHHWGIVWGMVLSETLGHQCDKKTGQC